MFNIVSLAIGAFTLLWALIAFLPLLGWANWFLIPFAIVGALIGQVSSSGKAGRNLNLIVIVIAIVRLHLGFGII